MKLQEVFQSNIIQFIKFGLVGLSNTAISYFIYALLVSLNVHYVVANVIAFVVSVMNSFYWNSKYVFKKADDKKRCVWKALLKTFISYGSTGLILSNILLILFVEKFKCSKYIAPLIILVVTIPLNFILNKFWAFKGNKKVNEKD